MFKNILYRQQTVLLDQWQNVFFSWKIQDHSYKFITDVLELTTNNRITKKTVYDAISYVTRE